MGESARQTPSFGYTSGGKALPIKPYGLSPTPLPASAPPPPS